MGVIEAATQAATALHEASKTHVARMTQAFRRLSWLALIPLLGLAALAAIIDIDTVWSAIFVALSLVLFLKRQHDILASAVGTHHAPVVKAGPAQLPWARSARRGVWWLAALLTTVLFAVAFRLGSPRRAAIFAVCFGLASGLVLWRLHKANGVTGQAFKVVAGLTLGPIVTAWFVVSTAHVAFLMIEAARGWSHVEEHTRFQQERERRTVALTAWKKSERPTVALALSGGGYRAAMTHAGVLWALDQAGIPVKALSTVSGGSIVGAAYALGWTPERFVERLCSGAPGLPNMLLNFYPFMANLVTPWSSGDTYWLHFYLTFFHYHTLADTGPPDLIVNTTHYRRGQRVAFWRTDPPGGPRLAELVAASGAFPVAFDPVRIGGEYYMDGGIVENLGVEGLAQYLKPTQETPPLMLVSDLSASPKPPPHMAEAVVRTSGHPRDGRDVPGPSRTYLSPV
jgi:hypothetical protein